MKKFIPYEKLSKREQQRRNVQKRGSWGLCKPVTTCEPDGKRYSRKQKHPGRLDPDAFFVGNG